MKTNLLQKLENKTITKQQLTAQLQKDFSLLPQILQGISSPKPPVRYGCAKALLDLSKTYPEQLYPYFAEFTHFLDSKYRILIWNGLTILANLCRVDKDRKFDQILNRYYSFLTDPYMVTVATIAENSGKIVLAKPYLASRVTSELLKIEALSTGPHLTEECKRVIAEKAIGSFNQFYDKLNPEEKEKVTAFIKQQTSSQRKKLQQSATVFLKKWHNTTEPK